MFTRLRLAVSPLLRRMPAYQSIDVTNSACCDEPSFVAGRELSQLAEKAAARVHAGHGAARRLKLQPALEFEVSGAGANAGQELAAADRRAERVVGPGGVPGGEIGVLRRVVEEDPVKRIVRIVGKGGGGRLGDAAAVDDHEVGDRIPPPKGVLIEVVGRLDLVADGFEDPGNLVQQRQPVAKRQRRAADGVRTTSAVLSSRMPGLERLIHSQP